MKKTVFILISVMWFFGGVSFLADPTQYVSGWPGIASVTCAFILTVISSLEHAFHNQDRS